MLFQKEKPRQTGGTIEGWQQYCREVAAAAEMLQDIAMRAEGSALAASVHENGLGRLSREFGFSVPRHDHNAQTYATMMLGPFAALEALRRKLANNNR